MIDKSQKIMVVRAMELRSLTQCSREFDFQPLQKWPEILPAIAWRGHLVTGFDRNPSSGFAVNIVDGQLGDLLKACYPQLGLGELARLRPRLEKYATEEAWSEICANWGWRWQERLRLTLELILRLPLDLQNFFDEKNLGARELSPLLALPDTTEVTAILQTLRNFSRSEFTQALELVVELLLMGESPPTLLLQNGQATAVYLKMLNQKRRPQTSQQDQIWQERVSKWPWPAQTRGTWQRFGDQTGVEIHLKSSSPEDLAKQLARLETIREIWTCKN